MIALASLGALLLVVAEFLSLLEVRLSEGGMVLKTVTTGANNNYSLLLLALVAVLLVVGFARTSARPALLGLAIVGIAAAVIAFLGDLPDARQTGLVPGFRDAAASPLAGFYVESLGAVLIVLAAGLGLVLLGPPPKPRRKRASGPTTAGS